MTTLGYETYKLFGIAHHTDFMRTLILVTADKLDFSISNTPPRWQFTVGVEVEYCCNDVRMIMIVTSDHEVAHDMLWGG